MNNKKLSRLLEPNLKFYFFFMLLFVAAVGMFFYAFLRWWLL